MMLKGCLFWYVFSFGFKFALTAGIEYGDMHYSTWKPVVRGFSCLTFLAWVTVIYTLWSHWCFSLNQFYKPCGCLIGFFLYEMVMTCCLAPFQFPSEEKDTS